MQLIQLPSVQPYKLCSWFNCVIFCHLKLCSGVHCIHCSLRWQKIMQLNQLHHFRWVKTVQLNQLHHFHIFYHETFFFNFEMRNKQGKSLLGKQCQLINRVYSMPIIEADAHKCTQVPSEAKRKRNETKTRMKTKNETYCMTDPGPKWKWNYRL